jgi:hypothetical protein
MTKKLNLFFLLLLFVNTMLFAQDSKMARLSVYEKNKSYFYDKQRNTPVFLSGQLVWTSICTPKLWYSHNPQAFTEKYNNREDVVLDPDKVIEYMALNGGNCCRLTTLYGYQPEGKTSGPIYFPWSESGQVNTENGIKKLDLNSFNKEYWKRFRHYLGLLEKNNIYVILEVFPNLWGYPNSPLNPDNNVNYTVQDLAGNFDWYRTVSGGSKKVLDLQEKFVKKVVKESLPFKNVLYEINNQYLSEARANENFLSNKDSVMAWPRYWSAFIKKIGEAKGEKLLVSTMPYFHPYGSPKSNRFQWYMDDDLMDFVDVGWWRQHPSYPEYSVGESTWMNEFDEIPLRERASLFAQTIGSWPVYQKKAGKVKPIIVSKNLFWDGVLRHRPWPLWLGFVSGYAASSPHEPMSRSYWIAPRYEPTAEIAGHLHRFIRDTKIEFWNMKSVSGIAQGSGQDAYVLAKDGEEYVIYLVGASAGPLTINLPEGEYIVEYYDPKFGQWIDSKLCDGSNQAKVPIHKYYDELVVFIQKKEKREAVMGMKYPK